MGNGYIKNKKIQWIFNNINELSAFIPKYEGAYALDNQWGDIYIWNGYQWIIYLRGIIKVGLKRPKPDRYIRNNPTPDISSGYTFYCDVDLFPSQFMPEYDTVITSTAFIDNNGVYVEHSSSFSSGSIISEVSLSLA